jgi:hypothetical protein
MKQFHYLKLKQMVAEGKTEADIVAELREYSAEEVRSFMPKPTVKKKVAKKKAVKKEEPTSATDFLD